MLDMLIQGGRVVTPAGAGDWDVGVVGEKIVSVNNQEVKSADDILKVINAAKKDGRSKALFQIEAENGSRFVALPIDQG